MADAPADTAAPAVPAAPAPTATATPWHQGVDATILGHWQNKGYDLADPGKVAIEATKSAIEASKLLGVPANELLRMPKQNAAETDVKAFWSRLGVPDKPADYDLSGIKFGGDDLDPVFADTMRSALANAYVPKDKAATIVSAVTKFFENVEAQETATNAAKVAEERTALAKSWGPNAEFNRLQAMQGAKRLGVTPEDVTLLENQIGYSRIMEMFRRVGAATTEDTFVEGRQGGAAPATREAATARRAELESDPAWRERFLAGDKKAFSEWHALNEQEFGMSEAEAAA